MQAVAGYARGASFCHFWGLAPLQSPRMTRREWMAALLVGNLVRPDALVSAALADDLTALTMTDAAARIARRAVSPLELVNAYLERITQLNPRLNAFVTLTAARARADARRSLPRPLPPLFGIPIAHKDLFETAGIRTTAGSMLYDNYLPSQDAAIVSQLSRAGAITMGKTNTHELGGGVTTINPFYGTTRNPVDQTRIPGGSSGGSAAAVAGRLCAAATGSDTGGSVRIPAALCGCVGFKPTFGRISTRGLLGACPTFDHVGFLTRTVADAEMIFNAALPVPGSRLPVPGKLRVGVARSFFFDALQPDVAGAIERALDTFKARGATVTNVAVPVDDKTMARVFDPIGTWEIWNRFGPDWKLTPALFSPAFSEFFKSERPTVAEFESARTALTAFQSDMDRVFNDVDVIVTPTVPITAPLINGPIDGALILRNTWPFNAAGTPAISVPCGVDANGLPIGLQIIGRRNNDDGVLRAARMFAEAGS
jgi:aspartyl-tRNA(Asn)/glutamyl-tRNA(Gln) amidotransferase subunit A